MASERKKIVTKLDKIFSEYIRKRDKNVCAVCGSTERPTCGHLYSRSSYSTRWEEDNAMCQCWPCNYRHEFDFKPFYDKMVCLYGEDKINALYAKYRAVAKYSNSDLNDMIEFYKNKLNELKD